MNITSAVYLFYTNQVIIKDQFEIIKETKSYYYTKGRRYPKSEIGRAFLKSATTYPYIEIFMVDEDEERLREELNRWFYNKGQNILLGRL